MAAKGGIPDPESNPGLRNAIEKAKREQVPAHVIEKAIQKASGGAGEDILPARYEGFTPGGAMVIVDCLTDNNQRTISEVRAAFTKTGAKLGAAGSVAMWFDHLAVLSFKGDNEEKVLEALLGADVNVEGVECNNDRITIYAPPNEFYKAKTAVLQAFPGIEFEATEITFLPQSTKAIGPDDMPMFEKFMAMLNDCDDVQEIYHNADLPA
jgi:YebC/PmpR family DNA-binding regulatory protein